MNESHLTCLLCKMDATIRAHPLEIEEIVKELQEYIRHTQRATEAGETLNIKREKWRRKRRSCGF